MRAIPVITMLFALGSLWASCAEPDHGPPKGDVCTEGGQCELGVCLDGVCLDPAGDEDFDSLINGIEVEIGTDPFDPDTDKDGVQDGDEVRDFTDPEDTDQDGIQDAIESLQEDDDCDGISNQLDPVTEVSSENLVESGDGETYTGWMLDHGGWGTDDGDDCEGAPSAFAGSFFLVVGELCSSPTTDLYAQIDQTLWLPSGVVSAEEPHLWISAQVGVVTPEAAAVILITPQDGSKNPLSETLRIEIREPAWFEVSQGIALPPGTVSLGFSLRAERPTSGPLGVVFDEVRVEPYACDPFAAL
jgi:hypothetical protein